MSHPKRPNRRLYQLPPTIIKALEGAGQASICRQVFLAVTELRLLTNYLPNKNVAALMLAAVEGVKQEISHWPGWEKCCNDKISNHQQILQLQEDLQKQWQGHKDPKKLNQRILEILAFLKQLEISPAMIKGAEKIMR